MTVHKEYWPNGNVKYDGEMVDGKWQGEGRLFYENGKIHYKGEFENGEMHGFGELYNENEALIYRGHFEFGEKAPKSYNAKQFLNTLVSSIDFYGWLKKTAFFAVYFAIFVAIDYWYGASWAMYLVSLVLFTLAITFTIRRDLYYRYASFFNSYSMDMIEEKGELFKKKNTRSNIIGLYFVATIMMFNGSVQPDNRSLIEYIGLANILVFFVFFLLLLLLLDILSNAALKHSDDNDQFIGYSIVFGFLVVLIVFVFLQILF
ncbi:toxin-antitoxin system YwqK family antitoxin [Desulfuribacillus alkaliarsenatis]|uniref:MORN repeat protein n=1 Tax=Desulfuribacillus alkaliarsenatis TaxID=766136 RepID=A0A1E5G201_9FIRM|nr:hypothetical protein [Desulfuribacillus alkaliarsenatis]OEF97005.1 hypothetical protein BHF68_05230 [Desulfuribacillus alkaliarsenatis]